MNSRPLTHRPRSGITLDLYLRSLTAGEAHSQQAAVISRLDALEERGAVEQATIEVWGEQITYDTADGSPIGQRIYERIEAFQTWAAEHDRSLEPFFQSETVESELSGTEFTRIRFPTMTLVEYEDEDLRFVSPSTDGETATSVLDRLAVLESEPEEHGITADRTV